MSAQPMCRHGHGQCCLGQIRCYAHRPSVSSTPASLLEAPLQCHCCLSDCRVQPCAMCCHALQLLHSSPELTSNAGVRKASGCVKTEADATWPRRKLASRAAEFGGQPWLVSFSGMADVLGWPKRPPLVADADRVNVLASWAPQCHGRAPCQRFIPFAEVRNLSPEAFVHVLAHDLKVRNSAACSSLTDMCEGPGTPKASGRPGTCLVRGI